MTQRRITDPIHLDLDDFHKLYSVGDNPIIQLSCPCYSEGMLRDINALCEKFSDRLQVRFYGHYSVAFDCSVLRFLPAVKSLALDCLMSATNEHAISELTDLRKLSLGIFNLNTTGFLAFENLQGLNFLRLDETRKRNIDLSPLNSYKSLSSLQVNGHTRGIEALGKLQNLGALTLRRISKETSLAFINHMEKLRSLDIILGGRISLDEVNHRGLKSLSICQVLGLDGLEPSAFPQLETFQIENQIRIRRIDFSHGSKFLTRLLLLNCKALADVTGLGRLQNLNEIRMYCTAVDIDSILSKPLPTSLRIFAVYTGNGKRNTAIRQRLDSAGYRETDSVFN